MDNKYQFLERPKPPLPKIDPYVFGEPEAFIGTIPKITKPVQPKNPRPSQNGKNNAKLRSKPKPKNRLVQDVAHHGIPDDVDSNRLDVFRNSAGPSQRLTENLQQLKSRRQKNRDHTLLYYPRAGEEVLDSDSSGDESMSYQRHWFSGEPNMALGRSARLSQLRSQLRRRLIQLEKSGPESEATLWKRTRCFLQAACRDPSSAALSLAQNSNHPDKLADGPLVKGGPCIFEGCPQSSLPCTRHCSNHVMLNQDQLLFEHCTAKFSDNTQCCVPVFDVAHELPLCPEHARKRDNYHRKAQELKPKKARKKPASPTVTRPKPKSKPKKRKRPTPPQLTLPPPTLSIPAPVPVPAPVPTTLARVPPIMVPQIQNLPPLPEVQEQVILDNRIDLKLETPELVDVDATENSMHHFVGGQIIPNDLNNPRTLNNLNLNMSQHGGTNSVVNPNLGLGLGPLSGFGGDHEVFASLEAAEHDFGNVLNNLPADAFNDLFIENRNGDYEPSREETEELERALEDVEKDVQNLQRMGQTHGLIESALLAQFMDMTSS